MMRFLKKILPFSNKKTVMLPSEPMQEARYWTIINNSLQGAANSAEQEKNLMKEFEKLSLTDLIAFQLQSQKLVIKAYTSHLWCAAYLLNGGCSDSGFEFFKRWLVAQGEKIYYDAIKNPDTLVSFVGKVDEFYFDEFYDPLYQVYEEKTGLGIHDALDYCETKFDFKYPNIEFDWQDDDKESMRRICPQIFVKVDWKYS
jgi:hypothetical protein